jgi:hypothetical protein
MIEVNRKLYMHESTGAKSGSFRAMKNAMADLVSCLALTGETEV